jgi:hypothetical protein
MGTMTYVNDPADPKGPKWVFSDWRDFTIERAYNFYVYGQFQKLPLYGQRATEQPVARILTIEAGRLTEDGSHDDLIRTGGRYASPWRLQTGQRMTQGAAE